MAYSAIVLSFSNSRLYDTFYIPQNIVVRYSCRSLVYQRHYLVSIFSPRQQYLRYFSGAIFKLIVVAAPCSEYCPLSTDGNKEHNPRIATAIFSFIPETQRPVWLTFVMERWALGCCSWAELLWAAVLWRQTFETRVTETPITLKPNVASCPCKLLTPTLLCIYLSEKCF